jgi:hypothetical protein
MLFLLRKNEAASMFVYSIGMKIKLLQNFAALVSLSSFYIIRSGLLAFTQAIFYMCVEALERVCF